MAVLSHKAYEKIQRVAKLIHEELESQIKPSPILFESNKLPDDISEKTFTDALRYLSEEGLISYNCDTKNTVAFYEYDRQYRDAKEKHLREAIFAKEEQQRLLCQNISLYDNQRKAEAERWHSTIFTIQPKASFNAKYNEVMANYGSYSENEKLQPIHEAPIINFRLYYEVIDDSVQILISGKVVRVVRKSSSIGRIIMYSIDTSGSTPSEFTNIDLKKIIPTYTRNTSAVLTDFFGVSSPNDIPNLLKAFLRKVPKTSKVLQIRTEITADELEKENIDTELVRRELEMLAQKQR